MRKTVFIAVGVAMLAGFSACQKPAVVSSNEEPGVVSSNEEAPPPSPTLPETSKAAPPPQATPPPATRQAAPASHLAPEGVFYTTTTVSVTTDDGITGLPAGTRVVRSSDGRYVGGGHVLTLRPDQITNDLRIAGQYASAEQAAQALARKRIQEASLAKTTQPPLAPAASTNPQPQTVSASRDGAYKPAVTAQVPGGVEGSSSLGARHTKTDDGYLWQVTPDGAYWTPVKRLDGREMIIKPRNRPIR